jgi:hypothetical protein
VKLFFWWFRNLPLVDRIVLTFGAISATLGLLILYQIWR